MLDTLLDRTIVGGYSRLGYLVRRPTWRGARADPAPDALAGRTALVTGAGGGLGAATAAGLARLGARVHVLTRSHERSVEACAALAAEVPGGEFVPEACDIGELAAVRAFAADLGGRVPALDVLVHNAGLMPPQRTETSDGNELTLAVHVLGPHLLTALLRESLVAADGRVLVVSSGGMYAQRLAVDDPQYRRGPLRRHRGVRAHQAHAGGAGPGVGRRVRRHRRARALAASRLGRHPGSDGVAAGVRPGPATVAADTRAGGRHCRLAGGRTDGGDRHGPVLARSQPPTGALSPPHPAQRRRAGPVPHAAHRARPRRRAAGGAVKPAERADHSDEMRENVQEDLSIADPEKDSAVPLDIGRDAEARAEELSTPALPLGLPGRPLNRRSPFVIGMAGAAGVAVTVLAAELVIVARDLLVLIGLSLFMAIGLEPAVAWLTRRRLPRWAAVTVVVLGLLGAFGGFLGVAIPQLVTQATLFVTQVPTYLQDFQNDNAWFRDLDARFRIVESLTALAGGGALELFNGILGAGAIVFDVLSSTLIVIVLFVYFLGDFPRIRRGLHRAVPNSRRPRFILISDEVFAKVGAYVLGIMVCAVIAGGSSLLWMVALGVPFSLLLAIMVMLLDVIPVIGTSVAGLVCSLVAFTVSPATGIATAIFFLVYRVVEDYVLLPRIVGRAVEVPALLTIVALLLGGVLLGVIGAIVAVPVGAAILLVAREVVVPRLDVT